MSSCRITMLFALCATSLLPLTATASGGQPGLEIAVDAPWRIEPIPSKNNHVGAPPTTHYGPIPIVVTVHDAIFDVSRKKLPIVGLGSFDRIVVREIVGGDPKKWPSTIISHDELAEIEAKYGVSKVGSEPKHEICRPAAGGVNCDQRLPIDAGKIYKRGRNSQGQTVMVVDEAKLAKASHEWHASFFFTPKTKVTPGTDIQLEVDFITTGGGSFTTRLKVRAAAAPLPRFSKRWLYGDLHYHAQSTDNEGESGYSYRNVVRAMGAMGMDFVFATDHASDGTQTLGGGGGKADKVLDYLGYITAYNEARDLNSARFRWANKAIYGSNGANKTMSIDSLAGGKKNHYTNFKAYGVIPQVFMGEEIDSLPEMSKRERESGTIAWGDRQQLEWWRGDDCLKQAAAACSASFGCTPAPKSLKATCRKQRSKKKGKRWYLRDKQGKSLLSKSDGSRQHMVYLPYSTKGTQGWVSGRTSEYGGATKTLQANLSEMEHKGRAFLAHPTEGGAPGSTPGPNMITFSTTALDNAWRSRAILGLQLWNENDRYTAGPSDGFSGSVVSGRKGRKRYQPNHWRGTKWSWNPDTARTKAKCDTCDKRYHRKRADRDHPA